jgi:hypothetical protein
MSSGDFASAFSRFSLVSTIGPFHLVDEPGDAIMAATPGSRI